MTTKAQLEARLKTLENLLTIAYNEGHLSTELKLATEKALGIAPPKPFDLKVFAKEVDLVTRTVKSMDTNSVFGRFKVFIDPVYKAGFAEKMDKQLFFMRLWKAHQEGLLRLSRADMTPAMNAQLVRDSELQVNEFATFHFIDLE